jgi:outer membrane receptor protein involved in Fe transport
MLIRHLLCLTLAIAVGALSVRTAEAQSETATISGQVVDPSETSVHGAQIELRSVERGTITSTTTNEFGIYVFAAVHPGQYQLTVRMAGFRQVDLPALIVNVQDHIEQNFRLQVGSVSESVTVEGTAPLLDTQDATVSTLVDRQFVENLPINGRSFQTLISLTPGVVLTPSTFYDPGQFSVNGQRASSNYFTVDGVSANIGVGPFGGLSQTAGGSIPGFNAVGGTNSLVSEDALQEFRIQTSTFAPEFGRTPGAQVSLVTRSGTNSFHGTLFEYLRNDKLDANDWFSDNLGLPKSEERINDFGGVVGGPIIKDRTFFFFSYEGQRLRLPETTLTTVPSMADRQSAPAAIQPVLDAYPQPNFGTNDFNAGYSNSAALNATSLRIDHTLTSRINLFARYDYARSNSLTRGGGTQVSLSTVDPIDINTQTFTAGATWLVSPHMNDDLRFNYSRSVAASSDYVDTFGGAVPPPASLFPNSYNPENAHIEYTIDTLQNSIWSVGRVASNLQRQYNITDSYAIQQGSHGLKFGIDYRRLTPEFNPDLFLLFVDFPDMPSALASAPLFGDVLANRTGTGLFRNLGLYAQDTWRAAPRLTLTYGLRWDIDFRPQTISGPPLAAVTNFDNPSQIALAPAGTPVFSTQFTGFAPRLGIAYQLLSTPGKELVLRAGAGLFNDLATQEVGDAMFGPFYPYGALNLAFSPSYPLPSSLTTPPPYECVNSNCEIAAFDPHLRMPLTYQWNAALQQSLGANQTLSVTYLGASGHKLLQQNLDNAPDANFGLVCFISNAANSNYNAMQVQYQRRLARGVQALASYSWSHSIDDASSSSIGSESNGFGNFGPGANRGPSDFDLRNSLSAAVTVNIPSPGENPLVRNILGGWAMDNIVIARSAIPVNVYNSELSGLLLNQTAVRPDVVPGVPWYLPEASAAGGRIINANAFVNPPLDPTTGVPLRQGDLGRNALLGFGATQWDYAVRREFVLHEQIRLQFKAEFFNLLNHPNFANPNNDLAGALFGQSTSMLSNSLGSNVSGSGGFGFASVFEVGGPRSIQFGLKLQF